MRKWGIVFVFSMIALAGGVIYSCSKEKVAIQEENTLKNATISSVGDDLTYPTEICAGTEIEFCLTFPQATTGGRDPKPKETNGQVQLKIKGDDPATAEVETEYWVQIAHGGGNTSFCFKYTFNSAGTYDLRYNASEPGFKNVSVPVINCSCEESFTAVDNKDLTYTFSYTPEEDMKGAELVFTFAQSAYQEGFPEAEGWEQAGNEGQTMHAIMDLTACQTYTWKVKLVANCSGKSGKSNVWTDFKVNDVSKKNNLENFTQTCP